MNQMSDFRQDLTNLINIHSKENESNTPDFILAQYLLDCLTLFNSTFDSRKKWYERKDETI